MGHVPQTSKLKPTPTHQNVVALLADDALLDWFRIRL